MDVFARALNQASRLGVFLLVSAFIVLVGGLKPASADPSSDATLSNLVIKSTSTEIPLSPVFSPAVTSYQLTLATSMASATVTPTATDAGATITVNGNAVLSGTASGGITTPFGHSTINVVVTAEDGSTTLTYTIDVFRPHQPSPTPDNLAAAQVGVSYAIRFVATGFESVSGSLPAGLTFGLAGVRLTLEGTPEEAGKFPFTVHYVHAGGYTTDYDYVLTVYPDPVELAPEINSHVRGFVKTRMNLLASNVAVPGLEHRGVGSGGISGSLRPGDDGLALAFAGSFAPHAGLAGIDRFRSAPVAAAPLNLWIDGSLSVHNREENDGRWGTFGLVSGGADYLVTDRMLLGLSLHLDHMRDPVDADVAITGHGWMAGPYGSVEIGRGVFLNTSLLWGGSANTVDTEFFDGSFDTRRLMWDTSLTGRWQMDHVTTLTPTLRAVYIRETVADYGVSNELDEVIEIGGFGQEQLRASFGVDLARRFDLANGLIATPSIGLAAGLAGLDGSGPFGAISLGMTVATETDWTLNTGLRFNIEGDGQTAASARAGLGMAF